MVGEEAHPVVVEICLVDINDEVLAPSPKRCSHTYLAKSTNHLQTCVRFRMIKSSSEAHERMNLGIAYQNLVDYKNSRRQSNGMLPLC
jgi:hypothetical protein